MQTVSSDFTTNTSKVAKNVVGKVEIDWKKTDSYFDETEYSLVLEVERKIAEPEGGIQLAMADVNLANETDRFTPPATNP